MEIIDIALREHLAASVLGFAAAGGSNASQSARWDGHGVPAHVLHSIQSGLATGFQLATAAGPLCDEPMWGVAFEVSVWTALPFRGRFIPTAFRVTLLGHIWPCILLELTPHATLTRVPSCSRTGAHHTQAVLLNAAGLQGSTSQSSLKKLWCFVVFQNGLIDLPWHPARCCRSEHARGWGGASPANMNSQGSALAHNSQSSIGGRLAPCRSL